MRALKPLLRLSERTFFYSSFCFIHLPPRLIRVKKNCTSGVVDFLKARLEAREVAGLLEALERQPERHQPAGVALAPDLPDPADYSALGLVVLLPGGRPALGAAVDGVGAAGTGQTRPDEAQTVGAVAVQVLLRRTAQVGLARVEDLARRHLPRRHEVSALRWVARVVRNRNRR